VYKRFAALPLILCGRFTTPYRHGKGFGIVGFVSDSYNPRGLGYQIIHVSATETAIARTMPMIWMLAGQLLTQRPQPTQPNTPWFW
jgi:hypothetical protein